MRSLFQNKFEIHNRGNHLISWLVLSIALLAGMFFASHVGGQEVTGELIVEPASTVGIPAEDIAEQQSVFDFLTVSKPDSGDYLVRTRTKKGFEDVCVRARDQIWVVNARQAHCCPGDLSGVSVKRLLEGEWLDSDLESLVSDCNQDQSRTNLTFVHGNGYDYQFCVSRPLQMYQRIMSSEACRPSIRLIIFCWKAEEEIDNRLRQDFMVKSKRAVEIGKTFAQFLTQINQHDSILCGYSLGVQVVFSAFDCQSSVDAGCGKFRCLFLAPAFDPDFACANVYQYSCSNSVLETEFFISRKDIPVKASQWLARRKCRGRMTAIEKLKASTNRSHPICFTDVSSQLDWTHQLTEYSEAPAIRNCLLDMLDRTASEEIPAIEVSAETVDGQAANELASSNEAGLDQSTDEVSEPETTVTTVAIDSDRTVGESHGVPAEDGADLPN